jgi:tetratricopeptide (TPR) repeat protein
MKWFEFNVKEDSAMAHDDDTIRSTLAQHYKELVRAMCKVAEAYLYEARLDDALCLLDSDVLKLVERELEPEDRIRIQVQHAETLRYKGLPDNDYGCYDAALEILSEAEKTARPLSDKRLLADVVNLTGLVLYMKELWTSTLETPLRYFEEALALRRETNDQRGIAESILSVGYVYQNRTGANDEDLQKAFECFQEAYRLAEKGNYLQERAAAARHMAYVYARKGEPAKALLYDQEFLTINEEIGFKPHLLPAYISVGFAYLMHDELDKAIECFQSARALAEKTGFRRYQAESLFGVGAVKEAKHETQTALSYYQEALRLAEQIGFKKVIEVATAKIESLSTEAGEAA